jgi:hypothetical protein
MNKYKTSSMFKDHIYLAKYYSIFRNTKEINGSNILTFIGGSSFNFTNVIHTHTHITQALSIRVLN